jgi:hypothetical protein
MKHDRRHDEIVIASLINEFDYPRLNPLRGRKRSMRIVPRLEAEYGKRLVQEAWRRFSRWEDEMGKAWDRYDDAIERLGGDVTHLAYDAPPPSDECKAAHAEREAAVQRARRWLPLDDGDPLGDK